MQLTPLIFIGALSLGIIIGEVIVRIIEEATTDLHTITTTEYTEVQDFVRQNCEVSYTLKYEKGVYTVYCRTEK